MDRCECGCMHFAAENRWHACNCGRAIFVNGNASRKEPFGKSVRRLNPCLFTANNCRCKDAVALMNRWREKSVEHADELVRMLRHTIGKQDLIDAINATVAAIAPSNSQADQQQAE